MLGLTSLWIDRRPMVTPEINRRRAVFVLGRIDEILSWERPKSRKKTHALSSWGSTCARCGQNSTGGWRN